MKTLLKRKLWFLGLVATLLMVAVMSGVASASGPPLPFSASVTGLTAGGGVIKMTQAGSRIIIRTTGETTSSTLDCAGDLVCIVVGLDGATMTTSHNSLVRLTPTGPGTFAVNGHLQGTVDIGGVLQGPFEATISGTAACFPSPSVCATFSINVTDSGNWNTPGARAHGTLNLSVAGVVGVGLTGGGTLTGTIHL